MLWLAKKSCKSNKVLAPSRHKFVIPSPGWYMLNLCRGPYILERSRLTWEGAHRAQRAPVTFSCLFVQSEDREKLSGIIMYLPSKNEKELSNDSSQKRIRAQ